MLAAMAVALGCGRAARPGGPGPAASLDRSSSYLTVAVTIPPGCGDRFGELFLDGVAIGRYPVTRLPVPPGCHQLHWASAADCAGFGAAAIVFEPGVEHRLDQDDLRAGAFASRSCPR